MHAYKNRNDIEPVGIKNYLRHCLFYKKNFYYYSFHSSNEDIIQMILDGEHDDFGAEKLKGLMKILPEMDEIEMLKSYDGDKTKIGNAERFILQLVDVPK